jgi:hypothetical protein
MDDVDDTIELLKAYVLSHYNETYAKVGLIARAAD